MDVFRHGERIEGPVADFRGQVVLVSACLVGMPTRYDGSHALDPELVRRLAGASWVPVCPEEAGGLPTPRPPAELAGGDGFDVLRGRARVLTADGTDVSAAFLAGAGHVLEVARRLKPVACYLKGGSPSCGSKPSRGSAGKARGVGVCAALLIENGFNVVEI